MNNISDIISEVAHRHQISEEQVKCTIENVALQGLNSKDRNIRWFWRQVPKKGLQPTAEEVIYHLAFLAARTSGVNNYIY